MNGRLQEIQSELNRDKRFKSEGGTLADVFGRTVKTTENITSNRQDPEAVGDMDVARQIVFSP